MNKCILRETVMLMAVHSATGNYAWPWNEPP